MIPGASFKTPAIPRIIVSGSTPDYAAKFYTMQEEIAIIEYKCSEKKPYQIFVSLARITENSFVPIGFRTRYMFSTLSERDEFLMEENNLDLIIVIKDKIYPRYRETINQFKIA